MQRRIPVVPAWIKWWYLIQLLIFAIVPLISLGSRHRTHFGGAIILNLGALVIGLLPLLENRWEHSHFGHNVNLFLHYLVTFVQMMLPLQLVVVLTVLHSWTQIPMIWLVSVGIVYQLIIYVPTAYLVFGKIQSVVGRIVMSTLVIFGGMQGISLAFSHADQLDNLMMWKPWLDSGVMFAGMFVIFMLVTMQQWGYRGPTWKLATNMQKWPVFWIIIVCVTYSFWNGFGDGNRVSNLFTRYNFHFAKLDLTTFLTGVEPGIAEEWLWRFVVLMLLLVWVQKTRLQWVTVVWLDGLLFGFWHLSNMVGQGVLATVNQMISAAFAGALLAALYLYTRAIWVPMLFHTAIDALSFMVTGSTTMGDPRLVDWLATTTQIIVFVALIIYLLSGRRRQTIEQNWQLS